jgi:ribonuclease P protein component
MDTFRKEERLSKKREIDPLFMEGESFRLGSFRVLWMSLEGAGDIPCKVLFSASKRTLRKAVDRNKTRRRMREAYRQNKAEITEYLQSRNLNLRIAILYTGKSVPSYSEVEHKIILILHRLILNHEEDSG